MESYFMEHNDEELMALYQDGNEEAFNLLYKRNSSKIYSFLLNKLRNEEAANEIFQTTFLKLHKGRHLYNKDFPFLPWLFTICRNALNDHLRKKMVNKEIFNEKAFANAVAESEYESSVLPSLPANQQMAIELRYLNGFSFEEISQKLNTTSSNVRQLISRGTRKIKTYVLKGEKK
jgi:RNA polymerase sigma factor (sigma-70 family)